MSSEEQKETLVDKAKAQIDAIKTSEGRDALKDKAQKMMTSVTVTAKEQLAALKTKEGRDATIQKIKNLPIKRKVLIIAALLGIIAVIFGIGRCVFSPKDPEAVMNKKLGNGMAQYVREWLQLQGQYESITKEFVAEAQKGNVSGSDFMLITTTKIIPAAEAVANYSCPKETTQALTDEGKRVLQLCQEIGKLEKDMWAEYRNAAFMGMDRSKALSKRLDIDKLIEELKTLLSDR